MFPAAYLIFRASVATTLLLIPCWFVFGLVWNAFLAIVLRPWIRLPLFPILNWIKAVNSVRQLGATGYVLVVGVLWWGWTLGGGFVLFEYLRHTYHLDNEQLSFKVSVGIEGVLMALVLWSLTGLIFGYITWKRRA